MSQQRIESPCVSVCIVDGPSGACIGCGRTLAEIAQWTRLSDSQRRTVMDALPDRLEAQKRARAASQGAP